MLEIEFSADLEEIARDLTEEWEKEIVYELPLPIALIVDRWHREGYEWESVAKDFLMNYLSYLALAAVNDYIQAPKDPDFDANDELKAFRQHITEGKLLRIIAASLWASRPFTKLESLQDAFYKLEVKLDHKVKILYPELGVKTDRIGLLSALLVIRNKVFAHTLSLPAEHRQKAIPQILKLIRLTIFLSLPFLKLPFCVKVPLKGKEEFLILKGVDNFQIYRGKVLLGVKSFLLVNEEEIFPLYPLSFADREKGSLKSFDAEVFLFESIIRSVPLYRGAAGMRRAKAELSHVINSFFATKRVFESRQDILLENMQSFLAARNKRKLKELEESFEWDPDLYVEREQLKETFQDFINSEKKMLLLSGEAGTGKSAFLIKRLQEMVERNHPALFLNCVSLPATVENPVKLEEFLLKELGYKGNLEEVLSYFSKNKIPFVIFLDSFDSYMSQDKNPLALFIAINSLISRYSKFSALKVVIASRPVMFEVILEKGRLPSFADEHLYYFCEGRPFLKIGNFSEQEISLYLKKFYLPYQQIIKLHEITDQLPQLANPLRLKLFVESFIEGEASPKIVRNVKKRLKKKIYKKALERVALIVEKTKNPALRLSEIAQRDPLLLYYLLSNNWECLRAFQELNLVKVEAEAEDWIFNFSEDEVLGYLIRKRRRFNKLREFFSNSYFVIVLLLATLLIKFITSGYILFLTEGKRGETLVKFLFVPEYLMWARFFFWSYAGLYIILATLTFILQFLSNFFLKKFPVRAKLYIENRKKVFYRDVARKTVNYSIFPILIFGLMLVNRSIGFLGFVVASLFAAGAIYFSLLFIYIKNLCKENKIYRKLLLSFQYLKASVSYVLASSPFLIAGLLLIKYGYFRLEARMEFLYCKTFYFVKTADLIYSFPFNIDRAYPIILVLSVLTLFLSAFVPVAAAYYTTMERK